MSYKLAAQFTGHTSDVRDVSFPKDDSILSVSRDGTARYWFRKGKSNSESTSAHKKGFHAEEWDYVINYSSKSYINCVNWFETETKEAFIACAGQEKVIDLITPADTSAKPQFTLIGHTSNICSLNSHDGLLASGSWDCTAKIWSNFNEKFTLSGHSQAVWAVLILSDSQVLTGSADKTIKLWENGKLVKTFLGHTDAVRGLCKVQGVGFASCSNDSSVRIWKLDGTIVNELYGHSSFVYSVASLPTGEVISSGEDRTIRIWKNGSLNQTITLPSISVWSIDVSPSGDIVSGSSDGVVRVFSKDPAKLASEEEIKSFEETVANSSISTETLGNIQKDKLPGPEVLDKPGKKEGQVIMVKIGTGVEAYQWTTGNWQKIGEVVDAVGNDRKQLFEGKEYDFVFDVDVEDGAPPLKLPFNANENPYDAATRFLERNELPSSYLDQTAKFIINNSQPVTIGQQNIPDDPYGSRYIPGEQQKSKNYSSNRASVGKSNINTTNFKVIPQKSYVPILQYNAATIIDKLLDLNLTVEDSIKLTDAQVSLISEHITKIKATSSANKLLSPAIKIIKNWTQNAKLPGLDLLRIISPFASNIKEDTISLLLTMEDIFTVKYPANFLTGVRTLANLFSNPQAAYILRPDVIHDLLNKVEVIYPSPTKPFRIAKSTFYLNCVVFLNSFTSEENLKAKVSTSLIDSLSSETEPEAIYRYLVALGTILLVISIKPLSISSTDLKILVNSAKERANEPRTFELVKDIEKVI